MRGKSNYVVKSKIRGEQLIAKVRISPDLVINTNQCELLYKQNTHGFLKLNSSKRNKLEFSGPAGISLYERLRLPISEYDFFFIMAQIVDIIQKIEKVGLSSGNLVLDLKHIFYNTSTHELAFLYLPIATPHSGADIAQFVEQIIYSSHPEGVNERYLSGFSYFVKSLKVFDINAVERYIEQVDSDIVGIIKNGKATHSGDKKGAALSPNAGGYDQTSDDEPTDLMVDDDKTDIMSEVAAPLLRTFANQTPRGERKDIAGDEATSLIDDDATELFAEDDDKTELFAAEPSAQAVGYPVLIRVLTEEVIRINKSVFRIGKDTNCVDYVVSDNVAISRSHADIICRGRRYFVFDLRSKNKTYINNRVLPAEQEVEIFSGDVLKLANEEFLFQV